MKYGKPRQGWLWHMFRDDNRVHCAVLSGGRTTPETWVIANSVSELPAGFRLCQNCQRTYRRFNDKPDISPAEQKTVAEQQVIANLTRNSHRPCSRRSDEHKCPARGCREQIPNRRAFCPAHWYALPATLRVTICEAWQDRRKADHTEAVKEALKLLAPIASQAQETPTP